MRFLLIILLTLWLLPLHSEMDFDREQILQRIQPIGKVRIEGGEKSTSEPVVKKTETVAKKPGQETYEKYCTVCHQTGVAGAPKFRTEADWKPRLEKTKLDELVAIAIKGINAMPPKGTCGECTEEEIKNAIQYMLPTAK